MTTHTHRIRHTETQAEGTVLREFVLPADRAGDCAGLWYHVDFDDGLSCDVPAALTERICSTEGCSVRLEPHQTHCLHHGMAVYAPGVQQ